MCVSQEVANEAAAIRAECDANLAEAMPILNRAQAALDTLTLADIAVIKAMKHPPYAVRLVVESVCVLKVQTSNIICHRARETNLTPVEI